MKKLMYAMIILGSFSSFAFDIDTCSDKLKEKQMNILMNANNVLGEDIGNATTMYVMAIGYSKKMNCDEYENQLDSVLNLLNFHQ